jgi:CRISPR-associated exonuclease Cas4
VVHEIKKSGKMEEAHKWQVKYYILTLERNGIDGVTGILEYPVLRQTTPVELTETDRGAISEIENQIMLLAASEQCPPLVRTGICKNCSYYDFCYVNERIDV